MENGKVFEGFFAGAEKDVSGEVVFSTGMVGYPESLTDPSYKGQILVFTYPMIGNYGFPKKRDDVLSGSLESKEIQVSALVLSDTYDHESHWEANESLVCRLKKDNVPALAGIDTRTLTKIIRKSGVMKGIISQQKPTASRLFLSDEKVNPVDQVSCKEKRVYGSGKIHILLIDCGVKYNILRSLINLGVKVTRIPWDQDPFDGNSLYDGVIISNGPGDPKDVKETINTVSTAMDKKIPILGICLGNQILSLAAGGDTYKLKYGHRGQNQPVKDVTSGKCYITTQNHGYAVKEDDIPKGFEPWFINLNDQTNEGIRHKTLPFYSVQFHPEACPGPTDTSWVFDFFISGVNRWKRKNQLKY
ncbi:MAG: Carbamoyl-phosphate synthase small chain [Candidatus Gottesmanbacteria bacterium GW2011_GWC2_39_8]|uniref:Carbamoyl phosphate synthase small chain n=1 Tax=Candidatus Gottesmanbacteria bacterium GW2011_GWC2_39_8 TaxID=1618450 RepID=A0A0G0Q1P1_9BACT|nr:MAG: Carbamoyl-phosphate synthase small chain [Candidatus Gottesmanbacteria bacterium GW2011_GWC2_39_8]